MFISGCVYLSNETDRGGAYLEDCWILEQTQPDRKKLRENFGGDIV